MGGHRKRARLLQSSDAVQTRESVSMKALRGQSSGKQLPLRNMVARWLHAREEAIVAGVKVHSKVQLKDELPLAGVHR